MGDGVVEDGVGPSQADGLLVIGPRSLSLAVKVANVDWLAGCNKQTTLHEI